MNVKAFTCAIAAISMSVSGVAFAQNDKDVRADRAARGSYDVPASPRAQQQRQHEDDRRGRDDRGVGYDRGAGYDRGGDRGDRYARPAPPPRYGYRDGRGAGPEHNFYRGDRLPSQWRSRQYVVDDWRGHRLSAPPRGYQWVQAGGDYVLVAIATGIIASILLNQ